MNKGKQKHIGSDFDKFLTENRMLDEVTAVAHKRVLAFQIQNAMIEKHLTKSEMAQKMHTSRSAVNRLLNPNNTSITLDTIDRAAVALGKKLKISLA